MPGHMLRPKAPGSRPTSIGMPLSTDKPHNRRKTHALTSVHHFPHRKKSRPSCRKRMVGGGTMRAIAAERCCHAPCFNRKTLQRSLTCAPEKACLQLRQALFAGQQSLCCHANKPFSAQRHAAKGAQKDAAASQIAANILKYNALSKTKQEYMNCGRSTSRHGISAFSALTVC